MPGSGRGSNYKYDHIILIRPIVASVVQPIGKVDHLMAMKWINPMLVSENVNNFWINE